MRHFAPPFGRRHAVWAILVISLFWCMFIVQESVVAHYSVTWIRYFQHAALLDLVGAMNDGEFTRFSPLAFAPLGYFDMHVLVPMLGIADEPAEKLAIARRMVWFHPLFSAISCAVAASVTWRIFRDRRLVAFVILLVGLNDTIPFQMRFVALLSLYGIQICTILAIYYLARLEEDRSPRTAFLMTICSVAALGFWEQGLDLVFSILAALGINLFLKRAKTRRLRDLPEVKAFIVIVAVTALYLIMRLPSGVAEAMGQNRDDSYFLAYRNPLPMIDDLMMNISGLCLQAWRQFLPFPPLSFAVMSNVNMNALNAPDAQNQNMSYLMMGMWYSGIAVVCTIGLIVYAIRLAIRKQGYERHLIITALSVFMLGATTHLPIMHRDYFYTPGFALGYKICVSYIGFVMLLLIAGRELLRSAWFSALSERRKIWLLSGFGAYYCLAAVSRAVLGQLPQSFPW